MEFLDFGTELQFLVVRVATYTDHLSSDHMLQHARMTLALAYELAFAQFD